MAWAAQIGGGIIQGQGAKAMAEDEEALLEYNAALAEKEANLTRISTAESQKLKRDRMRKTLASNRAAVGASGVMMTGSPAENQLNVIADYAYDIAQTGRAGEIKAQRFESQASLYRMRARSARRRGKIQEFSSILGGSASAAGTYAMSK